MLSRKLTIIKLSPQTSWDGETGESGKKQVIGKGVRLGREYSNKGGGEGVFAGRKKGMYVPGGKLGSSGGGGMRKGKGVTCH